MHLPQVWLCCFIYHSVVWHVCHLPEVPCRFEVGCCPSIGRFNRSSFLKTSYFDHVFIFVHLYFRIHTSDFNCRHSCKEETPVLRMKKVQGDKLSLNQKLWLDSLGERHLTCNKNLAEAPSGPVTRGFPGSKWDERIAHVEDMFKGLKPFKSPDNSGSLLQNKHQVTWCYSFYTPSQSMWQHQDESFISHDDATRRNVSSL